MTVYLNFAQIIISIVLIVVVLIQSKGSGFSGTFSNDASVFRTRSGLEKTLFQMGIGLGILFVAISVASVLAARVA